MNRLILVASLAFTLAACGTSHTDEDGGGIAFDADIPEELCGNGSLDPTEMCDDGNRVDGDGCDSNCAREAYCGDGAVDTGEACDDGNNRSGDGCRSDCQSDESCGNGITDFAVGEICDGEPDCGPDCASVAATCGDGTMDASEQCDDGNIDPWDGCNAACQDEVAMVLSALSLAGRSVGCDLNGDGSPDNAFARALGILASFIGPLIESTVITGDTRLLLGFQGLDDPAGANDDDFRIAWLTGADGDMDPSNDFGGAGVFVVSSDTLNPDGSPLTSMQSSVVSNALAGGPEDIPLPIGIFPIELRQAQMAGTTVADLGELYEITDGLLCGGIPVSLLSLLGGFIGDMLVTDPPCDGGAGAELLDVIIGGGNVTIDAGGMMIPLTFAATAPDLDIDADGLEGFTVESAPGCQAVVTGCIDGDGTAVDGRGCYSDPRIADGYSSAFEFTAIHATITGIAGP